MPNEKEQEDIKKEQQEDIIKNMSGGFKELAKHEAIIRRTEEIKKDSIKITLLEDIAKKLDSILAELKDLNSSADSDRRNRYV